MTKSIDLFRDIPFFLDAPVIIYGRTCVVACSPDSALALYFVLHWLNRIDTLTVGNETGGIKSIKSIHFYCHITTAHVPW